MYLNYSFPPNLSSPMYSHITAPYTLLLLHPHHHGCPSFSSQFSCSFQDVSPPHCIKNHVLFTLEDQMAISQTCTFMHDVVAYLYSIKTTLDFSSTLTIYQNDIRGTKRFLKTTFINLPDDTVLSILHKHTNTQHIFLFHLPPYLTNYIPISPYTYHH